MKPTVTLVEWTRDPDLVLYVLWHASRTDEKLFSVDELKNRRLFNSVLADEIEDIFLNVIGANIPVAEAVRFTFMFENITVAWREQLVRHRANSYWSQSSRARPLGEFFEQHIYWTPDEISDNPEAEAHWDLCMRTIGETYQVLESIGISRDNARGVLPQYMTHRISMTITLRSLVDLIKARTCWIAQSDIWHPIIRGMLEQISNKVDSRLAQVLGSPPCANAGKYHHCPIGPDNELRLRGEDPEPPCPLWLGEINHQGEFYRIDRAQFLIDRFSQVWHPDLLMKAISVLGGRVK